MNKVLSIIIPMYNMEKYIDQCLSSLIFDKGMELLEVLVINDGSKDNSSSIAHTYQEKYPNTFRVIDKTNGNYGSCINRGLMEATGKYIRVLDADDYYESKHMSLFLDFLGKVDMDMVFTDYNSVFEDGTLRKKSRYIIRPYYTYGIYNLFPRLHMCMHAVTYKTEILRAIHYRQTEGISYTDQEWIFYPMSMVRKWQYFPYVIYNYREGRQGQSVGRDSYIKNISQEITGFKNMIQLYESKKTSLDDGAVKYMLDRLKCRAKFIYKAYLLFWYDEGLSERMSELKSLDEYIKDVSCDVYAMMNTIDYHFAFYSYKFISQWRNSNYNPMLKGLMWKRKRERTKH